MTVNRWSSVSAVAVILFTGCTAADPEPVACAGPAGPSFGNSSPSGAGTDMESGGGSALVVDFSSWPQRGDVMAYTAVATGIVYVEAGTAKIVWESWQHQRKVIGQLGSDALADPAAPGIMWQNRRDIVGDPLHDLVAWVEVAGEAAGHLVVVQASTGEKLARTDIRSVTSDPEVNPWVEIASVDEESLHFSLTHFPPPFYRTGKQVWTWHWAAGGPPVNCRGPEHRVMDVSGAVWAIDKGATLRFEDATGQRLSEVPAAFEDRTTFGIGLSPDGRYWYGPAYGQVVDTTTGALVTLDDPAHSRFMAFGWTGKSTVTILSGPILGDTGSWVSCDAVSGACRSAEYCGSAYCGEKMPLQ
jgi:hypothetical protein